jgi:hypothetical protein
MAAESARKLLEDYDVDEIGVSVPGKKTSKKKNT